jgi:tetratricopeptide (TPR) repeat protein
MLRPGAVWWAAILDATGRQGEAMDLLEAALATFERRLGPDHHEVAVTLGNRGAIDARRGKLESADYRPRRAPAIKEQTLGSDHVELVPTLGTLGVICRRRGHAEEARSHYERALRILVSRGLGRHPQVETINANLARLGS